MTYEELQRLAAVVRRGTPSATLNPTALVNEAWLKLMKSSRIAVRGRRCISAARRRNSGKRGGGQLTITFDPAIQEKACTQGDLLAM